MTPSSHLEVRAVDSDSQVCAFRSCSPCARMHLAVLLSLAFILVGTFSLLPPPSGPAALLHSWPQAGWLSSQWRVTPITFIMPKCARGNYFSDDYITRHQNKCKAVQRRSYAAFLVGQEQEMRRQKWRLEAEQVRWILSCLNSKSKYSHLCEGCSGMHYDIGRKFVGCTFVCGG